MKWNPRHTLFLASLIAVGYGLLVWYIIWGLNGAYSVEGTRLLLVLTLMIAIFSFGGLLIFGALFADKEDEKFQDRFRLAREIFLVFSGIFGTIIGFYFGTDETGDQGESPAVEIAYADGSVTAAVTGGAEPFIGIITRKDAPAGEVMTVNKRTLTYSATPCPEDASILVVDGRGRRAEGSVKCGGTGAGASGAQENGAAANQNEANNSANAGAG